MPKAHIERGRPSQKDKVFISLQTINPPTQANHPTAILQECPDGRLPEKPPELNPARYADHGCGGAEIEGPHPVGWSTQCRLK